jgi:RNA polymerase sigma-70 factor (ECF subfamily)
MVKSQADAEDITQDVLAVAFLSFHKFKGHAIPNSSDEPTEFVYPGTQAENREKAKILYRAIGNLPLSQRTAFILCETENLSYKQISEVMDLTVASVESLLFRAKKNLRKIIGEYYNAEK